MRTHGKVAALTVGLALLAFTGVSPTVFTQYGPPPGPPPPCHISSVSIQGPSQGTVGDTLTFKARARVEDCGEPEYRWSLASAPAGAPPWSAQGQEVSYTPSVAGEYVLKLEVTAEGSTGPPVNDSAQHKLMVSAPPQLSGIQEYALILGPGSSGLRTFPGQLTVAVGSLRLFLTSLDRVITVMIRREGAQAGVATVLVEPGKLATIEVELAQGVYSILDQSTNSQLGQIEAR